MNLQEIRAIAKQNQIHSSGLSKSELIHVTTAHAIS